MNSSIAALVVLACTYGATLLGMWLARRLPEHHLSEGSKSTVRVAMGMTATIASLILGLVTASAKSDFDDDDDDVRRAAPRTSSSWTAHSRSTGRRPRRSANS